MKLPIIPIKPNTAAKDRALHAGAKPAPFSAEVNLRNGTGQDVSPNTVGLWYLACPPPGCALCFPAAS